jgi:hypothetical protein
MRDDDKEQKEIAAYFGVSQATISRWTRAGAVEHDRARSRAWKARNREANRERDRASARSARGRGLCSECGMPKGIGGAGNARCMGCISATAEVRRTLVEGMWAEGWTCREIFVDVLGVHTAYIGPCRRKGWNLPHRRTPEQVARIRAGSMAGRGLAA